jgi:hypothetical protein
LLDIWKVDKSCDTRNEECRIGSNNLLWNILQSSGKDNYHQCHREEWAVPVRVSVT